jgi:hypothetical protein
MKKLIRNKTFSSAIIICLLNISFNIFAHTSNETTLFPDIASSDSRFDVILLVSVGIIPATKTFEPEKKLSRIDLAAWTVLASGQTEAGDAPVISQLAEVALAKGLIESLEGNASYADINKALFMGKLSLESATEIPTRAQAASFVATNLAKGNKGETLLDKRGMSFGPTGEASKVESRMNPDGGTSYFITIVDETYPVYSHGKVANGPTDLNLWQKRIVRRSIVRNLGGFTLWVYLEAEDESHAEHKHSH